ncbi:MAG: hypothetical protein HC789_02325 [Microcoleus sp. CSU_2_2]|nr:hypothetical protein [Microcoleus sp. SU_5_3]NJS09285.1 hypothetical protein [Microcoleus sp. CSU_2_2]
MTKSIYALLVGIDNYHPNSEPQISSLNSPLVELAGSTFETNERRSGKPVLA